MPPTFAPDSAALGDAVQLFLIARRDIRASAAAPPELDAASTRYLRT
ncbi:hypothetical protein [Bradyrhizobium diversitatis]|uniref:Uncharacterized protein n=1 Tax=Bradyrhizobium diversitatis TaxID=2755406 RepID=A0ABS0P6L5_9BRAD|nr:hypothetical protein [Bradyrhizobium diversitatis]MBH5388891.1 hypothetical protein [Bradyrhizobium diversitatis]